MTIMDTTGKSTSTERYIACRRVILRFPDIKAAAAALPRIRRADPSAQLVAEDKAYDLLRTTPAAQVVSAVRPRGN